MVTTCEDIEDNLKYLWLLESLVYPGDPNGSAPYTPPPVSKFMCGRLLGDNGVCVVLKNYSVRFPTDVAWDADTYLPYRFSVSCQWEVVYSCKDLPTNCMIRHGGSYKGTSSVCPPVTVTVRCPPLTNEG